METAWQWLYPAANIYIYHAKTKLNKLIYNELSSVSVLKNKG